MLSYLLNKCHSLLRDKSILCDHGRSNSFLKKPSESPEKWTPSIMWSRTTLCVRNRLSLKSSFQNRFSFLFGSCFEFETLNEKEDKNPIDFWPHHTFSLIHFAVTFHRWRNWFKKSLNDNHFLINNIGSRTSRFIYFLK